MNREINEIFKQWKQFLSWCYESNDKTTEIHRDNLERVMAYTRQLENTIKEAREYIQDRYDGEVLTHTFDKDNVKELLEILDKVDDNK